MVAPGHLGRVWDQEEKQNCVEAIFCGCPWSLGLGTENRVRLCGGCIVLIAPGRLGRVWEHKEESGMSLKPRGGCFVVIRPWSLVELATVK